MREFSSCLNAVLALLALPLYLLVALAAMVGLILFAFTPDWLPSWLQFLATRTFLLVALGLILWFLVSTYIGAQSARMDPTWVDTLLGDGTSGYRLAAGLILAAVVLKLAFF